MARKRAPIVEATRQHALEGATRQIANRERRDANVRHLAAIEGAIDTVLAIDGPIQFAIRDGVEVPTSEHAALIAALIARRDRLQMDTERYFMPPTNVAVIKTAQGATATNTDALDYSWQCALDGENIETATARILLERGASSYQLGGAGDTEQIVNGAARKRADRAKSKRAEQLQAELDAIPRLALEPNGDHIARSKSFTFHIKGPHASELRRADLAATIGKLTVDKKRRGRG